MSLNPYSAKSRLSLLSKDQLSPIELMLDNLKNSSSMHYFIDNTGAIPAEFTFDSNIDCDSGEILISSWNIVPVSFHSTDPYYFYLEMITTSNIPDAHFLNINPFSFFTKDEFDLENFLEKSSREYIDNSRELIKTCTERLNESYSLSNKISKSNASCFGLLKAKSTLIHLDNQVLYLLELECDPEITEFIDSNIFIQTNRILIAFSSSGLDKEYKTSLEILFETIHVGKQYLFEGFKVAKIRLQPNSSAETLSNDSIVQKRVFLYTSKSTVTVLYNTKFKIEASTVDKTECFDDDFADLPLNCSFISSRSLIPSYVGRITHILDESYGVYILDNTVELHWTCCNLSSLGRGYRRGALIQVDNVHLLVFSDKNDNPISAKDSGKVVLAGCYYSSIRIIEFSKIASSCPVYDRQERIRHLGHLNNFNIFEIQVMQIMNRLLKPKFKKDELSPVIVAGIMELFGYKRKSNQVNIYNDFIQHGDYCLLGQSKYPVPLIPCINDVLGSQAVIDAINLMKMTNLSDTFRYKILTRTDFGYTPQSGAFFIGTLKGISNGDIVLADATGSIPVLLKHSSENLQPEFLNSMWAIRMYDIVIECFFDKLKMVGSKIYVRFIMKDAICLDHLFKPSIEKPLQNKEKSFIVFLVENTQSLNAQIENGKLFVDGSIKGIYWLGSFSKSRESRSVKCLELLTANRKTTILFDSASSYLVKAFNIGKLYIIENPDSEDIDLKNLPENMVLKFSSSLSTISSINIIEERDCDKAENTQRSETLKAYLYSNLDVHKYKSAVNLNSRSVCSIKQSLDYARSSSATNYSYSKNSESLTLNVVGRIINRDYQMNNMKSEVSNIDENYMRNFIDFSVGSGVENAKICIKLLDLSPSEDPLFYNDGSSYLKCSDVKYHIGLLPGSIIQLNNLEMKVSKSNIVYANFGSLTSFYTLYSHNQVEYKCNAIEKKISLQSISHRSFISDIFASEEFKATIIRKMHRNRPNDVYLGKGNFILRSTICSIKSIELWCLCKNCQSQTFLGLCPRNCSSGKLKGTDDDVEFHGKALFGIDDGSSFANVTISYFLGIKKLLCIPNIGRANDLWQVLKNKLKLEGTVSCFFETDGYADDSPQYEKEINVERSSESILMNLIKRSQYISPKSFLLVCEYPIWHQIVTESDFSFPIERFRIREFGDLVIRQVSFPSLFLNCKRIEETDLKLEGMLMVDL